MNHLPVWATLLVSALVILSGIVALVGTIGLVRLQHFYSRMHAPTLGNTFGVFLMLVATAVVLSFHAKTLLIYPLIITVLLVVTSPVTAILLMRAAIKRETAERLAKYAPDEPGLMDMPTKAELPAPTRTDQ